MSKEIVKKGETALAVPADMAEHAGHGTEGLGTDDVRPPRLSLAQSGSPQVKKGDPKFIKDLHEGDLFNDLTGDVYGEGPIEFSVIRFLGKRAIEFAPMDDGGGIVDFDVPLNDPRCSFTTDADGKRIKPVATVFYEYLVFLPKSGEIVALSMKNTQLKTAKVLNSLLMYPLTLEGKMVPNPPAWSRKFELGTAMESKDKYTWAGFTLKPTGINDLETRQLLANFYEAWAEKNVIIEHEHPEEEESTGDTPF